MQIFKLPLDVLVVFRSIVTDWTLVDDIKTFRDPDEFVALLAIIYTAPAHHFCLMIAR